MIDMDSCFRKNEQIIYKELEDGPALIDPYRRTLMRLNSSAAEVWRLLDGINSVGDIVEAMSEIFDINKDKLKRDVAEFLRILVRREAVS